MRRSRVVREPTAAESSAVPDLARSVAFAREARDGARYEETYVARETRAVRLSGTSARGVAVLGLLVLASAAIAGFSAVRVHAVARVHESLYQSDDVEHLDIGRYIEHMPLPLVQATAT